MPVQFLSGGGGGVSDVRDTFAAPVLTDCAFTYTQNTKSPIKWTIPANYLQVNDSLCCSLILEMISGNTAASINSIVYLRLGTTGSVTDALVAQANFYVSTSTNLPEPPVFLKGLINIKTTGTSGTCVANLSGVGAYGGFGANSVGYSQTIDTSSVLYLTIWVMYNTGGSAKVATLSPVGSSICVSF